MAQENINKAKRPPARCPACDDPLVEYTGSPDVDDQSTIVFMPVLCMKCGAEWHEIYRFEAWELLSHGE